MVRNRWKPSRKWSAIASEETIFKQINGYSFSLPSAVELENFKEEILRQMRSEITKAKQEIIETMESEFNQDVLKHHRESWKKAG